jgi:hypothetical protein
MLKPVTTNGLMKVMACIEAKGFGAAIAMHTPVAKLGG